MMHRSKKLLGSGDQEYFKEKRPVNVRVDGTAHLAELFLRPEGMLTNTSHHRGSVRVVGHSEVILEPDLPDGKLESRGALGRLHGLRELGSRIPGAFSRLRVLALICLLFLLDNCPHSIRTVPIK